MWINKDENIYLGITTLAVGSGFLLCVYVNMYEKNTF